MKPTIDEKPYEVLYSEKASRPNAPVNVIVGALILKELNGLTDEGVFMSMADYEEREKMFRHRDMIYAVEMSRLSGEPVYTQEEMDAEMEALFRACEK